LNASRIWEYFSSPVCPDWLWGPPSSYQMDTGGFFPKGKAAGM